jgi:hypothetical protein
LLRKLRYVQTPAKKSLDMKVSWLDEPLKISMKSHRYFYRWFAV